MKHNQIILCGVIRDPPKILKGTEGRVFAQFRVITINGNRSGGRQLESKAFDAPLIHTNNPALIESVSKLETGDFVIIKGAITTAIVSRHPKCPNCSEKHNSTGILTYVSPASVTITGKSEGLNSDGVFDKDKVVSKLKEYKETSNILTVMGVVCREPKPYKTDEKHKRKMSAYQLAIKRKLRIIGELDDNTADFPWVKSYGKISMNDGLYIKKGTYMFIDGWLRARKFTRKATCEHCGEEIAWTDYSCDIVPYASEYIKNYKNDDEITSSDEEIYNSKRVHINSEDDINTDAILAQEEKEIAEKVLDEINNRFKNTVDEIEEEINSTKEDNNTDETFSLASLKKTD